MHYRQLAPPLFLSLSLGLALLTSVGLAGAPDLPAGYRGTTSAQAGVAAASESRPRLTLVAPAAGQAVQLAVPLPATRPAPPRGSHSLIGVGAAPQATVPTQIGVAIAQDGTADPQHGLLIASLPASKSATKPLLRYQLSTPASGSAATAFRLVDVGSTGLEVRDGEHPVLVYNYGVVTGKAVPQTDARRQRACYIHPLWDLDGQIVTDDFPKDHYHHHGVFWAWPHIAIDGQQYDLWVYGNIQQKFVRWLDRTTGPVAAVLGVENGWFVGQRRVMTERLWLRVFKATADARAIDVTLVLTPVGKPVTLRGAEGKSYGGLTVRFAPRPPGSTAITTPAGRTPDDLLNTPLAWADLTAPFGPSKPSGLAVFVAPRDPGFPQAWLLRHYGALCVGWPGVKPQTLPADQSVRLDYRLWVHRGQVDRDGLKAAYRAYTATTQAHCE